MTWSAIIPAVDERETLARLLAEVRRLRPEAIIVVANGDPGGAVATLATRAGARVIRHEAPVGHDVGRALGASEAPPGHLLFVDADLPVTAGDLEPFLRAVDSGVDVALNRLDPYIQAAARLHPVNAAKRFLACALQRPDLGCASLTAVPHALSRRAYEVLGPAVLAVPPLALSRAVLEGLQVEAVHPVDVVRPNARRPGLNLGHTSPVEQLILGDHLEAINWVLQRQGSPRGPFSDLGRHRELLPR
jgi:glycosyltransferase involved in cell wall biosynthesis